MNLSRNTWSESYLFEGLFARAREQDYGFEVIDGGALTVSYSHASAEHLGEQLDAQQTLYASTSGNQPRYDLSDSPITLGAATVLWENQEHATANFFNKIWEYAARQPGFEDDPQSYVPDTSTLAGYQGVLKTLAIRRPYTVIYAATALREEVTTETGVELRDRSHDDYFGEDDSALGEESSTSAS